MTALFVALGGAGVLGLLCFAFYHAGKSDQKAEELNAQGFTSRKARLLRDRLRRDAAYAKRVRARFTR